jgi:hypothetical protein
MLTRPALLLSAQPITHNQCDKPSAQRESRIASRQTTSEKHAKKEFCSCIAIINSVPWRCKINCSMIQGTVYKLITKLFPSSTLLVEIKQRMYIEYGSMQSGSNRRVHLPGAQDGTIAQFDLIWSIPRSFSLAHHQEIRRHLKSKHFWFGKHCVPEQLRPLHCQLGLFCPAVLRSIVSQTEIWAYSDRREATIVILDAI